MVITVLYQCWEEEKEVIKHGSEINSTLVCVSKCFKTVQMPPTFNVAPPRPCTLFLKGQTKWTPWWKIWNSEYWLCGKKADSRASCPRSSHYFTPRVSSPTFSRTRMDSDTVGLFFLVSIQNNGFPYIAFHIIHIHLWALLTSPAPIVLSRHPSLSLYCLPLYFHTLSVCLSLSFSLPNPISVCGAVRAYMSVRG